MQSTNKPVKLTAGQPRERRRKIAHGVSRGEDVRSTAWRPGRADGRAPSSAWFATRVVHHRSAERRASVTPAGVAKRCSAAGPWLTPWAIFRRRCRG
jgi:hypothetical protein